MLLDWKHILLQLLPFKYRSIAFIFCKTNFYSIIMSRNVMMDKLHAIKYYCSFRCALCFIIQIKIDQGFECFFDIKFALLQILIINKSMLILCYVDTFINVAYHSKFQVLKISIIFLETLEEISEGLKGFKFEFLSCKNKGTVLLQRHSCSVTWTNFSHVI